MIRKMFSKNNMKHLDSIFPKQDHNNSWCTVTSVVLLLCLSLLSFNYFSSYENSIHNGIRLLAQQNESVNIHVEKDPCSGRYIYMHDLPVRFNQELVKNCRTVGAWFDFCPYLVNGGFGPHFNDSSEYLETLTTRESWYETNQFMLSVIFHHRMKQYKCLTRNSSLGLAIYLPFYAGLEVMDKQGASALNFTSWLREQPEWGRALGWDHFYVAGRISSDFRRPINSNADWGTTLLNLPEAKNMTMLTIESSPYGNNDFAIPYPTYFHPSRDIEVLEWQQQVQNAKRSYLYTFGGAPRPNMKGSIRQELISQCQNASRDHCNLVSCKRHDDVCNSGAYFIKMYMNSRFCLQPPGDSPTRRSAFDSILAGCIPVFFHPGSAYTQYLWHLPKNYTKYSVFVPETGIRNRTVSVEEILSRISEDEVSAMREEVIGLIPSIIYARNKLMTTYDAFDYTIERVLERIDRSTRQFRQGKNPNRRFPESKSWKYYLTGNVGNHEWDPFFPDLS